MCTNNTVGQRRYFSLSREERGEEGWFFFKGRFLMERYYYIHYIKFLHPTNIASVNLVTGCSKAFLVLTILTPPALPYK